MSDIERIRTALGFVFQRAAAEKRESDLVDLRTAFNALVNVEHRTTALQLRADEAAQALEYMVEEHGKLLGAVLDANEEHPLIEELAETIRREEWAAAAADGVLSPNEWAERLNTLTGNADPASVAVLVRVITGEALDSDGRVALVELIRRIAWENKP